MTDTAIMAIPIIRHNKATAFLCEFFFNESFVKIGTTNQIISPNIIVIMIMLRNDIGEEALF